MMSSIEDIIYLLSDCGSSSGCDDGHGNGDVGALALLHQLGALVFVDSAPSFARGCNYTLCCCPCSVAGAHPRYTVVTIVT